MRSVPAGPAPSRVGSAAGQRIRQRTSAFERVRALPDHRLVDGLLRSRAWIVIVALLLGGIVAMQVSLLKLNAGISRAVETSATLERQNADMADSIARLSSGERIRSAALAAGMVSPPAGDIGFLRSRGDRDAALASQRMQAPSAAAKALMANSGRDAAASTTALTATTTATTTTATTTTAPTTAATTGAPATTAAPTTTTPPTTTSTTATTTDAPATTPDASTASTAGVATTTGQG
jgi:hypothetical protein